jgi:predicted RNA-binding protein with PUA-like domain
MVYSLLMNYFLLKTEPSEYSIDDLKRDKITAWFGVRNYQARNIIRDEMKKGDWCIIYHSSCEVPAAVGVGKVVKEAYPDKTQFDRKSDYYDGGLSWAPPRWLCVDVQFVKKFIHPVSLAHMRTDTKLKEMRLLAKGNRLSVMPLSKQHFTHIVESRA